MSRTLNRPFFSPAMLVIAVLVILAAVLVSQRLVEALRRLFFQ